ncbi:uncharacterized protein K444DRAFT_485653, partial [Hyaloscypha bicolor E]
IRLVTIHCRSDEAPISCSLSIVSGDNLPDYEALPYVWGCQDDYQMIELNGMAWHVTRNLFFALSRLRSPDKDRTVWIDALSINQVNIPEINVQVMRLCTIYSRASCALICLSLEDR